MTNEQFEEQMKQILKKASDASDMSLTWHVVSTDLDCVADFGCDAHGNLALLEASFPLKIADLTGIRYRWVPEGDYSECFIRFDFGKDIYLDCCFDDCGMGRIYNVRYYNMHKGWLSEEEAIAFIEEAKNKSVE